MGEAAKRKKAGLPPKTPPVAPAGVKLRLRKLMIVSTFDLVRKDGRQTGEVNLPVGQNGEAAALQVFEADIPDALVEFLKARLPAFKENAL